MKQIRSVVILVPFLFSGINLCAQVKGIVLTGKVISFDGHAPIEGVTVQVKGTRNISGTLFDGMYAIEIRPLDSVLLFSYEGYETAEVRVVDDRKEYNVMLKSKPGISGGIDLQSLYKKEDNGFNNTSLQNGKIVVILSTKMVE